MVVAGSLPIGIIGGGIIGLAIGQALARRGDQVIVFEKESRVGMHQTGHNSGVVHAGLYYKPGSLKAQLCSSGRELLRDYCAEHHLPFEKLGKLVIAKNTEELPALEEIYRRSIANGVPDIHRVNRQEMFQIEPHVGGISGIHSPQTAVTDFASIAEHFAHQIRSSEGAVELNSLVVAVEQQFDSVRLSTPAKTYRCQKLIVCAGLHSDVIAELVGASPDPRILPFRGEYWNLKQERSHLVRGMIYPVPDSRFPFLGVHFTKGVYGDVHVGPNAVPALAREGYRWSDVSLRDTLRSITWPGAGALAKKHWRMGLHEIAGSLSKRRYFSLAKEYLPDLQMSDLVGKGPAGVRAQAWSKDGSLLDDFAIDQVGPITLVRNAPSPAATSSLAIARYLIDNHL